MADEDREYVSGSGRRLKWRQFAYVAWKEGAEVESGEGGSIIFEGEVFEPVEESEETDDVR